MSTYLKKINRGVKKLFCNEKGQGLIEYALLLVLIAVFVVGAISTLGTKTSSVFSKVGSSMP